MADLTRRIVLELLAKNKAAGELAAYNRSIDTVYRGAKRLAGGLLAAAGVGGLGYVIKQQMEAIDSTAKLSDRLGISTENLVSLQHAAKLAGVEHVGLGSDFDGITYVPEGLEDVSAYPNLIYELLKKGYGEPDLRKVCGENFLRTWAAVEKAAAERRAR